MIEYDAGKDGGNGGRESKRCSLADCPVVPCRFGGMFRGTRLIGR